MKNFKLLLASTAILSTAGLMVNASVSDGTNLDTDELYAYVQLVEPIEVTVTKYLDFGIISHLTSGQSVSINTATGEVTGNATRIGNYTQRGMITVSNAEGYTHDGMSSYSDSYRPSTTGLELSLPTEIRLTDGDELCGYVDSLSATNNGLISIGGETPTTSFNVGGTFTAKTKEGVSETLSSTARNCSGHGTVTVVVGYD